MTFVHDLIHLTQLTELSQLYTFLEFLQKRNFLEHQETEVSSRDIYVIFLFMLSIPFQST